jgi:hypothetical protein
MNGCMYSRPSPDAGDVQIIGQLTNTRNFLRSAIRREVLKPTFAFAWKASHKDPPRPDCFRRRPNWSRRGRPQPTAPVSRSGRQSMATFMQGSIVASKASVSPVNRHTNNTGREESCSCCEVLSQDLPNIITWTAS